MILPQFLASAFVGRHKTDALMEQIAQLLLETHKSRNIGIGRMHNDRTLIPADALLELLSATFIGSKEAPGFVKHATEPTGAKSELQSMFDASGWYHMFDFLTKPGAFHDPRLWAVFWALVEGEGDFLVDFLPFASHEERATGYFLSSLVNALRGYQGLFTIGQPKPVGPAIRVFDTATDSNEKITGADIGLIVRSGRPGNTLIKVARLQVKIADQKHKERHFRVSNNVPESVKKAYIASISTVKNGTSEVPDQGSAVDVSLERLAFQQLKALSSVSELGYYLVMNEPASTGGEIGALSSLVIPAQTIASEVDQTFLAGERASHSFDPCDKALKPIPFFAFLGIGLTSPGTGYGKTISVVDGNEKEAIEEAIGILFNTGRRPRHCMLVDAASEPLQPRLHLALSNRFSGSVSSSGRESAWPFMDSDGAPTLPSDFAASLAPFPEDEQCLLKP